MSQRPSIRFTEVVFALVVLFGSAGFATGAPDVSPAGTKSFEGWTGTCNNLGACVALGTADSDSFFYIRMARGAGAAASPELKMVLVAQDKLKEPLSLQMTVKGKGEARTFGPFDAKRDPDTDAYVAKVAPGEASLALIEALRNADTLDYVLADAKGTLGLKGLSATLRWIDAQQGRAGTPTALVARGMTPVGQVPEPRTPPTIIAAPTGSVAEITQPVVPKPILAQVSALPDCEKETVQAPGGAQEWRLSVDLRLISVPCLRGAYNVTEALYFTDAHGGNARPARLPQPPGGAADNLVTNMSFEPATMTLSDFGKGRGLGDCGLSRTWVWTGKTFALFEATRLDTCPGALPGDWPNIYTGRRG